MAAVLNAGAAGPDTDIVIDKRAHPPGRIKQIAEVLVVAALAQPH